MRLGLIPLTTDLESYSVPEECDCGGEGCTNCEVSLTIDVEAEDDDRTVYSSDLESSDPEVQPA
ncbi:MAG: DNA-directed RNA polymerase subunit D, partial [Halobacteria archaeon]|nr:DNA-directed RNA polymerase subunit D [Halobacteria archaeon]